MLPLLLTLRHRTRLTAWLGLLALCAQLWAGGISNWNMVQRLAGAPSLLDICSSTGGVHNDHDPANGGSGSASQHCPFCLAASGPPLVSAPAAWVAHFTSDEATFLASPTGVSPRAPDARHARTRAPPFFA